MTVLYTRWRFLFTQKNSWNFVYIQASKMQNPFDFDEIFWRKKYPIFFKVQVMPYQNQDFIASMTVTIDFNSKKKTTKDSYNTDDMLKEFLTQFPSQTFSQGQQGFFQFGKLPLLSFSVKDMEVATAQEITSGKKARQGQVGISLPDTMIVFEKGAESAIFLAGKSKGKAQARQSIINPDWDFSKMGIGGLDDQFNTIFRRAFASRVFPPEIIEQLGCKHVKGVLLFGPPGTGKTLMARQIGKKNSWKCVYIFF